MNNRVIPC